MSSRQLLIEIAAETEQILRTGRYRGPGGVEVDLAPSLSIAVSGTVLHRPDDPLPASPQGARNTQGARTRIEVTGESTLDAAHRLATQTTQAPDSVACLNFASATMPGGGFASGARAQEESLARSSGLVACLRAAPEFYEFHRGQRDPLYSDRIIYSPSVPVFRDDSGALLAQPYHVTFLTSPAPNVGEAEAMPDKADKLARIPQTITSRAGRILAVAAAHGHRRLVLGAWGCGVFRNEPSVVAEAFARHLVRDGEFAGCFDHVVFAILESAPDAPIGAVFRRTFD